METCRREFLSPLEIDTSPVQPPITDRNGMPLDEPAQVAEANAPLLGQPAAAKPTRPLNRKERRAWQKQLERKLRKAK